MATTELRDDPAVDVSPLDDLPDFDEPVEGGGAGIWLRRLVILVVLGLVAVGTVLGFQYMGSGGEEESTGPMLTHKVAKGELLVTVTEDGNLESAENVEIKCRVAGGSTILWIIPDGTRVKTGEELVRLDSAALEDQITQQKTVVEKARATKIQAEKDFNVAKISVEEYTDGTYRQELQTLESQLTVALEGLRSSQNTLQYTERMFRRGYVSKLQLEQAQFAVKSAELDVDAAETAKDVLEKFTRRKMLEDLNSQRDIAETRMETERAAFDLEQSRLEKLETQRENCLLVAPQDGMVVYANERGRFGSQGTQIEEGAAVKELKTIIQLPDLTQMQVKVKVHESKVEQLEPGMRANIRIQERELQGTVISIANQPESTSFFQAQVNEYATIVRIDGTPEGLKPGMTGEVEILVEHLRDATLLPVAAVKERRGGKFYCWVKKGNKTERRLLKLAASNNEFVAVDDGVVAGEEVVLNPLATIPEAREDDSGSEEETDVKERFGEAPADLPTPRGGGGRAPGAGGGGPGGGGPGGGGGGGRGNLMDSDADGDGKISKAEAPEWMRDRFDRMDPNGDGFIDQQEIDAMRSRRGGGGGGGGRPGGGPGGGDPGGGPAT